MLTEGFVYRISAPGSNSVYVGQSVDPKKRFRQHKGAARRDRGPNPALNRFLRKHPDAVLYNWPVFDMDSEEIKEEHLCRDMGLSLLNCIPCGGGSPMRGRTHTPESRAKLSAAHLGSKRSLTHCANISKARKGIKLPSEHCANISAAQKGRKHTDEARAKMTGLKKSPEHRAKISATLTGVPWSSVRRAAYENRKAHHAAD